MSGAMESVRCSFFPGDEQMQVIRVISQTVLVITLLLAAGFCVGKKQWKVLPLFGFFGLFFLMHAIRTYTLPRYGLPIVWVTVLAAWYGLKSAWGFAVEKRWLPSAVQVLLQVVIIVTALVWVGSLWKYLPKLTPMSRHSASVPYVVMLAVAVLVLGRIFLLRQFGIKKIVTSVAIFFVMGLLVVSNQFGLVQKVGNGSLDREFKYLADWYYENASPGEKMLTTMPHVVTLFLPADRTKFIQAMQAVPGNTPQEFLQTCYDRDLAYIVWDSRIGLARNNSYYRKWKMQRVDLCASR